MGRAAAGRFAIDPAGLLPAATKAAQDRRYLFNPRPAQRLREYPAPKARIRRLSGSSTGA